MREEGQGTIFESVEFIFRHLWIFFSTIIIIMSIVFAQLSFIKLEYRSQSIIAFETISVGRKRVEEMLERILIGESMRGIIKEVWPGVDEKDDPGRYEGIRGWLRGTGGVRMDFMDNANFMTISFRCTDPELCFKVVQATINAIKREARRIVKTKLTINLNFLKGQMEYYRDRVKNIDEELAAIKMELRESTQGLGAKETVLVSEITGDRDYEFRQKAILQKFAKYDEILVDLDLQLLTAAKKKQRLEDALEKGDFFNEDLFTEDYSGDRYIRGYDDNVASKALEIANLRLQGYLPEHPKVRRLEREIKAYEQLKNEKLNDLSGKGKTQASERTKREAEARIEKELKEIGLLIETLQDKASMIAEEYKKRTEETIKGHGAEQEKIAKLAVRLKELREEKRLSQSYYESMRQRVEDSEIKNRAEESEAALNIVVAEPPKIPGGPIPFQKTQKLLFGAVVSLFVGVILTYIVDSLDNSIRTASELRTLLKIPVLGITDRISTINEVRTKKLLTKIIILAWVVFILFSKTIVKLFFM